MRLRRELTQWWSRLLPEVRLRDAETGWWEEAGQVVWFPTGVEATVAEAMEDLDRLQKLGTMVRETSLCGLGQGSPNPVFSTLRYFRDEYVAHIQDRVCPAGVCNMEVSVS